MTIVELPNDVTGNHWIRTFVNGEYVATVWGVAEVERARDDTWCITIKNGNSLIGFLHADAIRRG